MPKSINFNWIPHTIICSGFKSRYRIGVGEKPKGWDLADYVLGRFSKEEEPVIRESLQKTIEACCVIMNEDIRAAMNRFN